MQYRRADELLANYLSYTESCGEQQQKRLNGLLNKYFIQVGLNNSLFSVPK